MDRPYERAGYNNDTVVYTREIRTTPIGYESRYGEHHNIIVSEPQSNRRVIQISDPHRSVTNNVIIENKPKSEENRKVKDIINNNNVFNKNERNNSSYDGRDRLNYR
jgi:2,3-bisphosphoglycerate-independent phosphoglycerate mutase